MQFARGLLRCTLILFISISAAMNAQQAATSSNTPVVPRLVNFSGKAVNEQGKPIAGITGITFAIYKDQDGGSPLWLETQNVTADAKGSYTVQLGATTAEGLPLGLFTSGDARWLGVRVNGGEEGPRVLLLSVPYALKAADAETVGGLPASAFLLAGVANASAAQNILAASSQSAASSRSSSDVTTSGGTANTLPLFTTANNIQSSILTQTGSGATGKIGINTTSPASTLDVNGAGTIRGNLSLPATGAATTAAGKNSQPTTLIASAYNSTTKAAVLQNFRWQAEPAGNNTAAPSGTVNLLYSSGTATPTETGLKINNKGLLTFAAGQSFPGAGTITGVTAGTDLTGGGVSGKITLNLDTTKIPQLNSVNTFVGNQTVTGNVTASGIVSASSFEIGKNLFAFGSYANENASLGFAGNTTMTGFGNTASGFQGLFSNTTGSLNTANGYQSLQANSSGAFNTAIGEQAMSRNTSGGQNTASGAGALSANTTGNQNTAAGLTALSLNTTGNFNTAVGSSAGTTLDSSPVTGSNNAFFGSSAEIATGSLTNVTAIGARALVYGSNSTAVGVGALADGSNSTAIGANAYVAANNTLVLGSVVGVNGATSTTLVGIGTTTATDAQLTVVSMCCDDAVDVRGITAAPGSGGSGGLAVSAIGGNGDASTAGTGGGYGVEGFGGKGGTADGVGGYFTGGKGSQSGDGIDAVAGSGYAGGFTGNVFVTGTLSQAGGSVQIDHPLDPANKYLSHSFVESPDMKNIYDGVATLDANGEAVIQMPDWFGVLNRDFRYQLTCIGGFAPVYIAEKLANNQFKIGGGRAGMEVSWQITGIRQDAWANAHRIPVEEEKETYINGFYIHPELYSAPAEKQIEWARHPAEMKRLARVRQGMKGGRDGKQPGPTPPSVLSRPQYKVK